jgi:putative endonuclease
LTLLENARRGSAIEGGTASDRADRIRPAVMAGLVPAIHAVARSDATQEYAPMPGGWVYIMTNRPNGVIYTGVTADLARRVHEHREGLVPGFTRRYGLNRLVWIEPHDDIRAAIQREKNIKHWPRAWKAQMIIDANPGWADLYEILNQ